MDAITIKIGKNKNNKNMTVQKDRFKKGRLYY